MFVCIAQNIVQLIKNVLFLKARHFCFTINIPKANIQKLMYQK